MKKFGLTLAVIFITNIFIYAQKESYKFEEVVDITNTKDLVLYSRGKIFIANAFKSAQDVLQLQDEPTRTLIAKGGMRVIVVKMLGREFPGTVWFKLTLSCKDNKYKYSFEDFRLEYQGATHMARVEKSLDSEDPPKTVNKKQWQNVKDQVDLQCKVLIKDLKTQMATSPGEDW